MRGNAMRHDNANVMPMLRVPSRNPPARTEQTEQTEQTSAPAPNLTGDTTSTPSSPREGDTVISHGRVPDSGPRVQSREKGWMVRLLAGTATIAVAGGLVAAGITLYGPRLGIMVPFLTDQPKTGSQAPVQPIPAAAQKPAAPPANALTPPALQPKTPAASTAPQGTADTGNDNPFAGTGMALPPEQGSAPAQSGASQAAAQAAFPSTEAPATPQVPPTHAADTPPASAPALPHAEPPPARSEAAPPATPSPDAKLELELAGKLHDLDVHVAALDQRLSAVQDTLGERITMGLGKVSGRLDELEHREDQMDQALKATPKPTRKGNAPPAGSGPASATKPPQTQKAQLPAPSRPVYHVQAGAPGIAILQDSSGNPIRVENGETIPGWGIISSIAQTGSGWVVRTERGVIR